MSNMSNMNLNAHAIGYAPSHSASALAGSGNLRGLEQDTISRLGAALNGPLDHESVMDIKNKLSEINVKAQLKAGALGKLWATMKDVINAFG
jgi:hypothetical protein